MPAPLTMLYALLLIEPTASLAGGSGPDLTWLMTTSAVLILVIGVVAYAFRRLVLVGIKGHAAQRDLRILDVLPLGGKRQLAVVRCYDRTFALGLGEKSVEMVAELDTQAVDHDREEARGPRVNEARAAFDAKLQAAKERLFGIHEIQPRAAAELPKAPVMTQASAMPQTPASPLPVQVPPSSPTSTQEFVA